MGTDIHLYVEEKINDIWVYKNSQDWLKFLVKQQFHKDSYVGFLVREGYYKKFETEQYLSPKFYCYPMTRSYDLFSILANVRNGSHFGFTKTGYTLNYISEAKGLPASASKYIKQEYNTEYHHPSYFYLSQLFAFDWNQKFGDHRYIDRLNEDWKYFIEWCKTLNPIENYRIIFWFDC